MSASTKISSTNLRTATSNNQLTVSKKSSVSNLPTGTPILDNGLVRKYLGNISKDNPGLFTYYKGNLAPYCSPDMYYVCPLCAIINDNAISYQSHYIKCKNPGETKKWLLRMQKNMSTYQRLL